MIGSKGIRILCYILMTLVLWISLVGLIGGIVLVVDGSKLGWIIVAASVVFPLAITVSLYPIYALSKIESSLSDVQKKVISIAAYEKRIHRLLENQFEKEDEEDMVEGTETLVEAFADSLSQVDYEKVMDFMERYYGVELNLFDDLTFVKEKVNAIAHESVSVGILKNNIDAAKTIKEAFYILNMHRIVHEKN